MKTVTLLSERSIGLKVLTGQGAAIDTTTAAGRLSFGIFAALAEFESELIRERTMAGLQAARARGRKGGRTRAPAAARIVFAMASAWGRSMPDASSSRAAARVSKALVLKRCAPGRCSVYPSGSSITSSSASKRYSKPSFVSPPSLIRVSPWEARREGRFRPALADSMPVAALLDAANHNIAPRLLFPPGGSGYTAR